MNKKLPTQTRRSESRGTMRTNGKSIARAHDESKYDELVNLCAKYERQKPENLVLTETPTSTISNPPT
jgi:hypothetical protein